MSVIDNSLAGLTLEDVLGNAKRSGPPPSQTQNNTYIDSSIQDDTSSKEKKSWKMLRDKLRLKRVGSAWISSIHTPKSDVNFKGNRTRRSRHNSFPDMNHVDDGGEHAKDGKIQSQSSSQSGSVDATMPNDDTPSSSFKPQKPISPTTGRVLSAREAVASQEEAEAATKNNALPGAEEPATLCLMDLLGEAGSSYTMGEDGDECYDEDEEDEEEEEVMHANGTELTCCVCKVNFMSSVSMPCGHAFCRLCSKELSVERGNCSLCKGFVLEILDVF